MRKTTLLIAFSLAATSLCAQLDLAKARRAATEHGLRYYNYHQQYAGHAGYAAPLVITADSGAVFFGGADTTQIVKLDSSASVEWCTDILPKYDELETQSVLQCSDGGYYAFVLTYDYSRYRGGSERVVRLDSSGEVIWDKTLGEYTLENNPHCSYIRELADGRLNLRGHIAVGPSDEGENPEYHYWEGWLNSDGTLTQEIGDMIDWADGKWKDFVAVE